jgi:hypothetical protein
METETLMLGVVTQRKAIASRWQSHLWRPLEVKVDRAYPAAPPQCVLAEADDQRWLFSGLELGLHSDEAEGYFLNATATTPCWFVMSRAEIIGGNDLLVPKKITLSYNEAARLMDGGEQVDTMPAPAEIIERLNHFIAVWYRPEVKRKRKKPSFEGGAGVDLMARAEGIHGGQ